MTAPTELLEPSFLDLIGAIEQASELRTSAAATGSVQRGKSRNGSTGR